MAASRIILVEPDPFLGKSKKVTGYVPSHSDRLGKGADDKKLSDELGFNIDDIQQVSRPLRGIKAKPETHAFVQVIRADGSVVKVFNKLGRILDDKEKRSQQGINLPLEVAKGLDEALNVADAQIELRDDKKSGPNSAAWTDWILQSVQENRVEKTQIVETFGSSYLYAFGERPRSLVFNGLLLNTADYNWRSIFWENWDNYFRATRLVELNARMYISWDDIVVEGYPINAVAAQTADSPNAMTFSFNFYVTRYINIDADKGFTKLRADNNISALTTGYDRETAKLNYNNRVTALDMLGLTGSGLVGGRLERNLIETGTDPRLAAVAGRSVASAHRATFTASLASSRGQANGAAFLRAYLRKTGFDFTRDMTNIAFEDLEKSTGVRKSDVNAWFGYLATIFNDVPGMRDSVFGQILLHGSVDRVIQGMSYHLFDIGSTFAPKPSAAEVVRSSRVNDTGAGIFPATGLSSLEVGLAGAAVIAVGAGAAALGALAGDTERDERFGVESIKI